MSHSLLTTPKKKHAAVAIVTIGMAAVGYWFGSQRLSSKAPNPLIVPASALRLGKVLARGLYRHEIPLTNTSGETVTVARIESSCWCTQIEPASFSLGPGQSTTLVLSLDLMAAARLDSPQAEQELRVTLIPHIRERVPDQWPRWILAGQVQLPAVLNRSRVVFDGADRIVQGLPGPRCTARLITHAPVADLQVVSAAAASLVQAERQKLSESEWEIMFTARDGIPAGRFDELFYLQITLTKDDQDPPRLPIHVSGVVVPDVQALPELVALGPRPVDSEINEHIKVFSAAGRPFRLNRMLASSPQFTASCESSGRSQTAHDISLSGRVGSGRISSNLAIEYLYANGEAAALDVPLLLYGH
jgi:hypothetical protein